MIDVLVSEMRMLPMFGLHCLNFKLFYVLIFYFVIFFCGCLPIEQSFIEMFFFLNSLFDIWLLDH